MTRCFLLERVNMRTYHQECVDPDCDCGGWEQTDFDIRRTDTGEIIATNAHAMYGAGPNKMPVGAMWWADLGEPAWKPTGPDDVNPAWDGQPPAPPTYLFHGGPHLIVMTPGGTWNIDSRASNCGKPYDYEHRCWVRHGEPPNLTVDKNGLTCQAGAGSIQCGDYHGFLRDGQLT